jgi:hypothetical protein
VKEAQSGSIRKPQVDQTEIDIILPDSLDEIRLAAIFVNLESVRFQPKAEKTS